MAVTTEERCPKHGLTPGPRNGRCPRCAAREATEAWQAANAERRRLQAGAAMRRLRAIRSAEAVLDVGSPRFTG